MAQRLIMPLNQCRITAGIYNANYKKQFGWTHFGLDMTDKNRKDYTIWGSGNGEITHCGWHKSGGNVIVAVYKNCELPDGRVMDIAMRYYHLDKIYVKVGDKITKDTKLGLYGNTGTSSGSHLHLETDSDTKYPNYTPQMGKSGNNNVLRAGNDKTLLHPAKVLWVKTTAPDNQSVSDSGFDTVAKSDLAFKTTTKC